MKHLFYKTRKRLTRDETQEVLTPFAFKLDPTLFGLALASPFKRGVAICLDLFFIAFISQAGGEFLAIGLAVLAFKMGRKKDVEEFNSKGKVKGKKRRFLLRLLGAFILFLVLIEIVVPMVNSVLDDSDNDSNSSISANDFGTIEYGNDGEYGKNVEFGKAIEMTGFIFKTTSKAREANCHDSNCWQQVFDETPEQLHSLGFSESDSNDIIEDIVDSLELDKATESSLLENLLSDNALYLEQLPPEPTLAKAPLKSDIAEIDTPSHTETDLSVEAQTEALSVNDNDFEQALKDDEPNGKSEEKPSKPIYSFMALIKGIIDDLGLGFGWAAFYFTVFTSVWNGKTLGKKMLGIKVVQLDGTYLSIWDSFGRYGGYGAGIATGLLGFFQIYWDPNRQAIHDKISATVVIDEKRLVDADLVAKAKQNSDEFIYEHSVEHSAGASSGISAGVSSEDSVNDSEKHTAEKEVVESTNSSLDSVELPKERE